MIFYFIENTTSNCCIQPLRILNVAVHVIFPKASNFHDFIIVHVKCLIVPNSKVQGWHWSEHYFTGRNKEGSDYNTRHRIHLGTEGHFVFLRNAITSEFLNASEHSFESCCYTGKKKRGAKINLKVTQETYTSLWKHRCLFICTVLHIHTTTASLYIYL